MGLIKQSRSRMSSSKRLDGNLVNVSQRMLFLSFNSGKLYKLNLKNQEEPNFLSKSLKLCHIQKYTATPNYYKVVINVGSG